MTENEAIEIITNAVQTENMTVEQDKALSVVQKVFEEIQQYRAIGTVEECREAMEKQKPKKPSEFKYNNSSINYGCPVCKRKFISKINGEWCAGNFNEYCERCGQAIDWSEVN